MASLCHYVTFLCIIAEATIVGILSDHIPESSYDRLRRNHESKPSDIDKAGIDSIQQTIIHQSAMTLSDFPLRFEKLIATPWYFMNAWLGMVWLSNSTSWTNNNVTTTWKINESSPLLTSIPALANANTSSSYDVLREWFVKFLKKFNVMSTYVDTITDHLRYLRFLVITLTNADYFRESNATVDNVRYIQIWTMYRVSNINEAFEKMRRNARFVYTIVYAVLEAMSRSDGLSAQTEKELDAAKLRHDYYETFQENMLENDTLDDWYGHCVNHKRQFRAWFGDVLRRLNGPAREAFYTTVFSISGGTYDAYLAAYSRELIMRREVRPSSKEALMAVTSDLDALGAMLLLGSIADGQQIFSVQTQFDNSSTLRSNTSAEAYLDCLRKLMKEIRQTFGHIQDGDVRKDALDIVDRFGHLLEHSFNISGASGDAKNDARRTNDRLTKRLYASIQQLSPYDYDRSRFGDLHPPTENLILQLRLHHVENVLANVERETQLFREAYDELQKALWNTVDVEAEDEIAPAMWRICLLSLKQLEFLLEEILSYQIYFFGLDVQFRGIFDEIRKIFGEVPPAHEQKWINQVYYQYARDTQHNFMENLCHINESLSAINRNQFDKYARLIDAKSDNKYDRVLRLPEEAKLYGGQRYRSYRMASLRHELREKDFYDSFTHLQECFRGDYSLFNKSIIRMSYKQLLRNWYAAAPLRTPFERSLDNQIRYINNSVFEPLNEH